MVSSHQNRKRLTGLLILVVVAALLAVYLLYFRSRHEQPNEPPDSQTRSSARRPAADDWESLYDRAAVVAQVRVLDTTSAHAPAASPVQVARAGDEPSSCMPG